MSQKVTTKKALDLSESHLTWLIQSRMRNQNACLKLFNAFEKFPIAANGKELRAHSQTLVAVGFSLWRAAFLADKTGQRDAVFADAHAFLAELLTNNTISYGNDRSSREWTFNYYMTNANNALIKLSERWPDITTVLSRYERVTKESTNSRRRWNRHQNAFDAALDSYLRDLEAASVGGKVKPKQPASAYR